MEIQVNRFRETLGILKPAVPRKPTLDILKNVVVKDGKVMATDLESMVIINLPEADESFLLPYEEVVKMLKYVPGYERLTVHAEGENVKMSWPDGEASYPIGDVGDFPVIPAMEVKDEADIDGDTFIPALSSALPYVSTADDRPILNGVTVVFGAPIEISAGDGFRMAHIVLPLKFPAEYTTILPAAAVKTLAHVMEKTPRLPPQGDALVSIVTAKRQLQVALNDKRGMRVGFGPDYTVIIKLVEGTPPAWLKLIPKGETILKAQLFAREFETAVRRVKDVALQNSGIVRFLFQDGTSIISAQGDGREVSAKISVLDMQGAPTRFALNVKYLTEYLTDKDGIVAMSWTGGTSPVSFQHGKSPKVIIMPMNVSWRGPLPGEAQPEPEPVPQAETLPAATTEPAPVLEASEPKTKKPRSKKKEK
jgi:DNA polymerase III sliding clamp (beta) subunit (PCNA family)